MKMEEEFGVEIPEDKTEDLKTINDVANFLQNAN
jgi:acyl carrier protein